MKPHFFSRSHTRTNFINLDTSKCKACWKCLEGCPQMVLGRVDLPWHKHALIVNPDKCIGCRLCVRVCPTGSFVVVSTPEPKNKTFRKGTFLSLMVNLGLLAAGLAMVLSGFVIQFNYHMGHHGLVMASDEMWGLDYYGWADFHKISIVVVTLLMAFHLWSHWGWYKGVVQKKLMAKNKQVIALTILFLSAALTGYIPWLINLGGGSDFTRKLFIEIHDKLTLLLFIYLVLHVVKRLKWFVNAYRRIRIG